MSKRRGDDSMTQGTAKVGNTSNTVQPPVAQNPQVQIFNVPVQRPIVPPPVVPPPVVPPPVVQPPDISLMCQQIIRDQQAKIIKIQNLNYGWEGWLQVELALALAETAGLVGIQREERIYVKPNNRCDIWIPRGGIRPNIGIELKTKNNSTDFVVEFIKDYTDKCQVSDLGTNNTGGLQPQYDSQQGGNLTCIWGIGITTDVREADLTVDALGKSASTARNAGKFTHGLLTLYDAKLSGTAQYLVWWYQIF